MKRFMLILLILAAVIVLGPVLWKVINAGQEARAVVHIEDLGARIERDENVLGHPVVRVDFSYRSSGFQPVRDADLPRSAVRRGRDAGRSASRTGGVSGACTKRRT